MAKVSLAELKEICDAALADLESAEACEQDAESAYDSALKKFRLAASRTTMADAAYQRALRRVHESKS